jgi:DNA-binding NarL/FixJ family response regulator
MSQDKIKLVIVDDHPIIIQGLQTLLQTKDHIEITGSFTNGTDFMDFLKKNTVNIVLLDITLPDANGMDLCREIKVISPQTYVLALSNHNERSIIMQMLQNGASGYLLKNASGEELSDCINEALDDQITFSREVKEIIARPALNELKGIPQLTKREKEILKQVAEGKTTVVIADQLSLSPLTVETHRRNLMQKFEAKNVAELMKMAMQQKML